MTSSIRIGCAQIETVLGDIPVNVERHIAAIADARDQGCDLLLFPELSLTGYSIGTHGYRLARPRSSNDIRKIAAATGSMTTVLGFMEEGPAAQFYNAVVAVKDGEVTFLHRKLNLPSYGNLEEAKHFAVGRFVETSPLREQWRYAALICADAWNPALVHLAAMHGATLLLVPISSAIEAVGGEFSNPAGWDLACRFYAMMYGFPLAMVNRVGREGAAVFWGGSMIVDPTGTVLAMAEDTATLITADLDYEQVRRARYQLPTVRDSNFSLIAREMQRLADRLGVPDLIRDD